MIISNPVDILTAMAAEQLCLPDGRVFGTGCILGSSRFVRCIADYLQPALKNNILADSVYTDKTVTEPISGYVIGEHGDSQVPLWSSASVCGISIEDYCKSRNIEWNKDIRQAIADRTRTMGADIIKAKGRTNYGIATCACLLADAVLSDKHTKASVSTLLPEENNIALSVPCEIGADGVCLRMEPEWNNEEHDLFRQSAEKLRKMKNELPADIK